MKLHPNWPTVRYCCLCEAEIFECMGSVLARDFLMWMLGLRSAKEIRELCGKCALQQSEKGHTDLPFTDEEKRVIGLQ